MSGRIVAEGDEPKVAATVAYFSAIYAGLKTAEEYAREQDWELGRAIGRAEAAEARLAAAEQERDEALARLRYVEETYGRTAPDDLAASPVSAGQGNEET